MRFAEGLHRTNILLYLLFFLLLLYSRFIWVNGSITLIRAETDRYDIVRFSKVTTKSFASGTGF